MCHNPQTATLRNAHTVFLGQTLNIAKLSPGHYKTANGRLGLDMRLCGDSLASQVLYLCAIQTTYTKLPNKMAELW